MKFFPDGNTFIRIGSLGISWYSITIILSAVAGFLYFSRKMKANGYKQQTADSIFALTVIGALLGGRIGWVLEDFHNYSLYMWDAFAIHDAGMDMIAAFLGAGFFTFLYTHAQKMSFFRTMDAIASAFLLTAGIAAIGRCFAYPLTWITVALIFVGYFIVEYVIRQHLYRHRRGDITAFVLLWIGIVTLISGVFRFDRVKVYELIPSIAAEAGGVLLYYRNRKHHPVKPVILFDLDGTIMDSEGMMVHCFEHLLEKYGEGRRIDDDIKNAIFTQPLRETMEMIFPDRDPQLMIQELRLYQRDLPGQGVVELMPHAKDTLEYLKNHGYKLGIVSGRLTSSCKMWLQEFDLYDLFDAVLGRDQFIEPKPAADGIRRTCEALRRGHDDCVYIGDSYIDIETARNGGVFSVCLVRDTQKLERVKEAGPNYIITELSELIPLLQQDHSWSYDLN